MPDTIAYLEKGKGQPIILLHGFCETHEVWQPIIDKLADHYHVFAPDLPGFGNSPLSNDELTIELVAEKLSAWWKSISDEKVILFGHSLGGYIALAFAENHFDQLKGFGLIHSTAYADPPEKQENRLKAVEFVKKNGTAPFVRTLIPSLFYNPEDPGRQGYVKKVMSIALTTEEETIISYSLAMRARPPRYYLLSEGSIPVLFVAGRHDEAISIDDSEKQIKMINNGHSEILEDSGHMGMFEEPDKTVRAIQNFIDHL